MRRGKHGNHTWDESWFYEHWRGKHTRCADVITGSEVDLLEQVAAPWQVDYGYAGPDLGTRHVYVRHPQGSEMSGGKDLPELIEQRKQERAKHWEQRDADHARAMALDQSARELRHFHAAPQDMQPSPPRLSSKRRRIAEAYLQRMSKQWGAWSEWKTIKRPDGFTYQERERARS